LIAYKATALISATNELIDDNMTDQEIWTLMAELIAEKIAEFEDTNVLASSTKFTALLADSNVNVVTMANTKDSFADITYDNLIDLVRSVDMKYKKGQPRFFMHQDVIKYIEKLKDTTGQPIFYATRDFKNGQLTNSLL
jgi:HK97 family phage major capsid protein